MEPGVAAQNKNEAIGVLKASLERDRLYLWASSDFRCATFNAVPLDECDIWLIEVREDALSDCPDLRTAPFPVDTFVVYLRSKTIVWLNPQTRMYESWQSFLGGGPS
jgi:hypothetical protein